MLSKVAYNYSFLPFFLLIPLEEDAADLEYMEDFGDNLANNNGVISQL